jgi:RNA polymerase sigma-70 factor, ECF subfamily
MPPTPTRSAPGGAGRRLTGDGSYRLARPAVGRRPHPDGERPGGAGAGGDVMLRAVMERYRGPATVLAARICGAALAEDVVQEAFLSVWRSSTAYSPERGSMSVWVLSIVHHRAIDALRRNARHMGHLGSGDALDLVADPEQTDAIVVADDQARFLRSMLRALPSDQAEVISLAYFDELTHAEIAERTGLPLGTVKGRIRLGLAKLRALLSPAPADQRCAAAGDARSGGGSAGAERAVDGGAVLIRVPVAPTEGEGDHGSPHRPGVHRASRAQPPERRAQWRLG